MTKIFDNDAPNIILHLFQAPDLQNDIEATGGHAASVLVNFPSKPPIGKSAQRILRNRLRSAFAQDALRSALSWHLGFDVERDDLQRDRFGKTGLKNLSLHRDLQFNVSHAGNWICIAISHYPIGVDIERIRIMRSQTAFSDYFESMGRRHHASTESGGTCDLLQVSQYWCRAEAVAKCIGIGMIEPLEALNLPQTLSNVIEKIDTQYGSIWVSQIPCPPNYSAYVAQTKPFDSIGIVCDDWIQEQLKVTSLDRKNYQASNKQTCFRPN